jgi:cyclophilin family peptidyl-prolyl cis-trans isomerase
MKYSFFSLLFIVLILGCKDSDSDKEQNANDNNSTQTIQENLMIDITTNADSMLVAIIETNMGTIEFELFANATPKTVENFVGLANKGYYNGIIFHRVIDNFMIQGGDPTGTGRGGESVWGEEFKDEIVDSLIFDKPGLLAMANAGPNTNGSQFFITTVKTPHLNGHHTIFGKIIKGMDVVNAIGKVKTGPNDKPVKDVVMEKVAIEKRKK